MNKLDEDYQSLLKDILENGVLSNDRTGTGTISVFGRQIRHDMSNGFPLITTKKMAFKTMTTELLWFLKGDTNIKFLIDNKCNIWNGDAYKHYLSNRSNSTREDNYAEKIPIGSIIRPYTMEEFVEKIKSDKDFSIKWGELGPIYGAQWRNWGGRFDQISNLINQLRENPDSRRLLVSAWNLEEIENMTLPPCHYSFQVYTRELELWERVDLAKNKGVKVYTVDSLSVNGGMIEKIKNQLNEGGVPSRSISLMFNMRSSDTGLGLPANIMSYALLLLMLAKQVNMVTDEVIASLGDTHIYKDQIDGIKELITREPYSLPTVELSDRIVNDISEYTIDDIKLVDYKSHPKLYLPLSN